MEKIKKTLLHGRHVDYGAKMVDFGTYNMPLWYPAGAKKEHLTVLTHAGIFDTSHMAVVTIRATGKHNDAFRLLQRCFSRDLNACVGKKKAPFEPGKCIYGVYLDESGNVIDDAILYRIDEKNYITVVNSGMGGKIAAHLVKYADDLNVEISDLTEKTGKLDIQGPLAGKTLGKVLKNPEPVLENLRFFTLKGHFDTASPLSDTVRLVDGTSVLLSRTGYTGEFGFEIFMDPAHLLKTWEMILEAGKPFGLIPCGLAARDSLRTGALLPLSHQDIGSWPFINNPWCFALPYTTDQTGFTKTFVGDQALLSVENPEYTYAFAGYDLRKVSVSDGAVVLDAGENKIGSVLTCVTDMAIGRHNDRIYSISSPGKPENFVPKGLSCGFVKVKSKLAPGRTVYLKDNRRKIKVAIVEDIRPDRTALRPIREMI